MSGNGRHGRKIAADLGVIKREIYLPSRIYPAHEPVASASGAAVTGSEESVAGPLRRSLAAALRRLKPSPAQSKRAPAQSKRAPENKNRAHEHKNRAHRIKNRAHGNKNRAREH